MKKHFKLLLKDVEKELGTKYPLIINGEKVFTDEVITSVNPANKKEVIGLVSKANKDLAEKAMQAADETFKTWKKTKPEITSKCTIQSSSYYSSKKALFLGLMIKEAGKPWDEADADTAEAIDFLEYYGRQMLEA